MDAKYTYRRLDIYKGAKDLVKKTYALMKKFPREEQYALCDQLRRSIISVPSNLAEGLSRFSAKEKVHFIEYAYSSLMESQCQLEISNELGYISEEEFKTIDSEIEAEARMISGLRAKYVREQNQESLPTTPLPTTPLPTTPLPTTQQNTLPTTPLPTTH